MSASVSPEQWREAAMVLRAYANEFDKRAEPMSEGVDWRAVADVLAIELRKWGWGDFHYGPQNEQEGSVLLAMGIYEDACERAANG